MELRSEVNDLDHPVPIVLTESSRGPTGYRQMAFR